MCLIDGCDRPVRTRGWCNMHYHRWRRYGTTDDPRPRIGLLVGSEFHIELRDRHDLVIAVAIVDGEDAAIAQGRRWSLARYVVGYGPDGMQESLHRVLMGCVPGDGTEVDHIDRDRLNNRRSNLRVGDRKLNAQNQPARGDLPRGVHWSVKDRKWRANGTINRRWHHLGLYDSVEEAEAAAVAFRREHMPWAVENA